MNIERALVITIPDKTMREGRKTVFPKIGREIVEFLLCNPHIYPSTFHIHMERDAEMRADQFTITFER